MDNRISKMSKISVILTILSVLILSACSAPKDMVYFQDLKPGSEIVPSMVNDIKVRPLDKLSILVSTQDPELSQLFNLNSQGGGGGSVSSGGSAGGAMYSVTPDGKINFPVLGEINVVGKRRWEVARYIEKLLIEKELVKDPIVTVEYGNAVIYTLGEIGGGKVEIDRDRLTVVEAIALAGGIGSNGRKDNVMLLRETEDGKRITYYLNFLDMASLEKSPVYYVQQNDIIYVEPTDFTKRGTTPLGNSVMTPQFWASMVSMAFSMGTLIFSLVK